MGGRCVAWQINFGYCTLLMMDDLDVIPQDEVRSVTVQLVTYNGNLQSAYGTISIDFDFNLGTCVCAYVSRVCGWPAWVRWCAYAYFV